VETQFNYQTNPLLSKKCVALVYDAVMSMQTGVVSLKALRLTKKFVAAFTKVRT